MISLLLLKIRFLNQALGNFTAQHRCAQTRQSRQVLSRHGLRLQVLNMRVLSGLLLSGVSLMLAAPPALSHHAMGGKLPATFAAGLGSGLAHPLIGLDHLAFVVAIGLLAATLKRGIWLPLSFMLAAMGGTGFHLAGFPLPGVEFFVTASILCFGGLLTLRHHFNRLGLVALAMVAGLCHGYAYGEAIFGAETTPVVAYLIGFTAIQLAVSLTAFLLARNWLKGTQQEVPALRSAGLVICGIGLAFLSSQVVSTLFPI